MMHHHRQVILDTETTGLSPDEGHRVIEIGCIEMIDRQLTGYHFHTYVKPNRAIDPEALKVHGITNDFLNTQPTFEEVADEFVSYIQGAEIIIHNAPFDVAFINYEFRLLKGRALEPINQMCNIIDTLAMARAKHPGQRNSLDALCKRYQVNNEHRQLHGALLDAEILASVYLAMTGGQLGLFRNHNEQGPAVSGGESSEVKRVDRTHIPQLKVVKK